MKLSNDEQILDLLNKILRVLSLQVGAEKSITERVKLLKLAEVDNKTIARVLGIKEPSVRALLSQSRKRKGILDK